MNRKKDCKHVQSSMMHMHGKVTMKAIILYVTRHIKKTMKKKDILSIY